MNSKAAKNRSFMDTLVALFKNVWLKRGVALLCWGYTGLLIWIAWLNGAFFLEYENPTSLFVVYVFVNIAALGLLIYTRRQVITQVNVMILPPVVFATFLLAFGNWYMILPPLVVLVAMFFICTANETLKTVLGTMYLLMYVIGAAAYITITLLMGKITLAGVDLDLRDRNYEVLSADGQYRIVLRRQAHRRAPHCQLLRRGYLQGQEDTLRQREACARKRLGSHREVHQQVRLPCVLGD